MTAIMQQDGLGWRVERIAVLFNFQDAQRGRLRLQIPAGIECLNGFHPPIPIDAHPAAGKGKYIVMRCIAGKNGDVRVKIIELGKLLDHLPEKTRLRVGLPHPELHHGQRRG